jgi:hypothetical protein
MESFLIQALLFVFLFIRLFAVMCHICGPECRHAIQRLFLRLLNLRNSFLDCSDEWELSHQVEGLLGISWQVSLFIFDLLRFENGAARLNAASAKVNGPASSLCVALSETFELPPPSSHVDFRDFQVVETHL